MTPKQTIQSIYEAFDRGDVPYILSQVAPAADWHQADAEFRRRRRDALLRQESRSIGSDPRQFPGNAADGFETPARRRAGQYSLNGNSAKFYDKAYSEGGSVLRGAEATIVAEEDFRVYRPKEGGPDGELEWRPMRKGVSDMHRRTEVSQKSNDRLLNALAGVDDSRTVEELTGAVQKRVLWGGRHVRGLRPWGDGRELLQAINHGEFLINGFRNRDLQGLLYDTEAKSPAERRRRSAAISRKLRLLRAHGLIRKVPRTHRYMVTDAARPILIAVLTTARTSVHQLKQLPKAA